jgi:glycine betaine/proline transport system permease protein
MDDFRIPIGAWADELLGRFQDAFGFALDGIDVGIKAMVGTLTDLLIAVPPLALILVFAVLAWVFRSWLLAIGTAVSMWLITAMGQWVPAMQTLALVLVATIIAVIIAVPLGILVARNRVARIIARPVLDFMQTMPAFVYLIPAITFFSLGAVPGVVATIIFSLPPGVRFTELGIRGVDAERIEAGQAFGATPGQILRGIQLPLAAPTIMAGINQVIMLALSMAVIAGIAGADGLGKNVVAAVSTLNVPLGVEAGLSVVILAIFLDRVTSALGTPKEYRSSLRMLTARARTKAIAARATVPIP